MSSNDYQLLRERVARLAAQPGLLADNRVGIEKESLRVTPQGRVAKTAHPERLGSALTHPYITTDYSEALVELVTPPVGETWEALQCLVDLHQFVHANLDNEMLWATSMPCAVSRDEDVPIADYGKSNVGMMKTVYRRGLGHRYGRVMQAIAGVHFNYSVSEKFWEDFAPGEGWQGSAGQSAAYLGLLRNFRRFGWLTLYLFGASPAACASFLGGRETGLKRYDSTLFDTYATTLRMSDVGYKNKVQAQLEIPVNDLDEYIAGLLHATTTPHPAYEAIGVVVDGEYRQLNTNILQIENEYYSLIRPKRVARSGEKPTCALARGGIEYVEVRALDVSPFDPAGINQTQMRFLEAFLLMCLLNDSPPIDASEQLSIDANQLAVARRGRDPDLELVVGGRRASLADWAGQLCQETLATADLLDAARGCGEYRKAVEQQLAAAADPELTPSARVLRELREGQLSFFEFALDMSRSHRQYFQALATVSDGRREQLTELATQSRVRQREIEAADELSFAAYLRRYFEQKHVT